MQVQSMASTNGLRIRHCCELQHRLQMLLGTGIAVAVMQAVCYSSDSTPSLGSSICHGCGLKKTKKKKILCLVKLTQQTLIRHLLIRSSNVKIIIIIILIYLTAQSTLLHNFSFFFNPHSNSRGQLQRYICLHVSHIYVFHFYIQYI